jgi:hypothetical protein
VVLPLVPVIATTGICGLISCGAEPSGASVQRQALGSDHLGNGGRGASAHPVQHARQPVRQRLCPAGMAPRIGHDKLCNALSGPGTHGQPRGPSLPGQLPDDLGHEPDREALPKHRSCRSRPRTGQAQLRSKITSRS